MKHVCFLSLGSNLNSRIENIEQAIVRLSNNYTVLKVSSFYETDAWGYEDDLKYINCVVKIETSVDVLSLLNGINLIEKLLGRDRKSKIKYIARIIDIDILFYGHQIIDIDILHVPHKRLYQRNFVLEPLCEIAPHFICAKTHKTVSKLLYECTDKGKIALFDTKK